MMNSPSNTSSNVPVEKIRLIGDDEEDPQIEEDDGDNSIGTAGEEEVEDEEDNDIEDDIIDDDDDLNSVDADEIDTDLPIGNTSIARAVTKSGTGRVIGIQPLGVAVPPQFLDAANAAGGDETDDDIDTANMSGNVTGDDEYDDDDDEDPETYLQKFDLDVNKDLLLSHHPTQFHKNDSEISVLCQLTRNASNNVIDPLHKTTPFLTKYEKTRVIGQRAKQINSGSKPYIVVPDHILDGYIIAQMELAQKRIPFIIERPIHGGGCEYWRVRDLEIL
jgi:DNA-directed RNA polymerase subunit K/omega